MFVSNASETRVTVEKRLRIEIEKWVAGRQADLGLTLFPVESTAVEAQPITTFASVAILPASHRLATGRTLSPKELDGEPIILPKQSARLRQLADPAFLQTDVRIPPFFETSGAIASCHIRRRLGNRHKRPVQRYRATEKSVRVLRWEPEVRLTYGALWPKERKPSEPSLRLIEILRAIAEQIMRDMPAARPRPRA